jgi:hypothetical protein
MIKYYFLNHEIRWYFEILKKYFGPKQVNWKLKYNILRNINFKLHKLQCQIQLKWLMLDFYTDQTPTSWIFLYAYVDWFMEKKLWDLTRLIVEGNDMRAYCSRGGGMLIILDWSLVIRRGLVSSEDSVSDANTWIQSSYWNRIGRERVSSECRMIRIGRGHVSSRDWDLVSTLWG